MSQPYESPRASAEPGTPLGAPDVTDYPPATHETLVAPDVPVGAAGPADGADEGKAAAAKDQAAGVARDAKDQVAGVAADAKDQAAGVAADAKAGGQQVAGVAKEEARQVASVAGQQARTVLGNARTELTHQVGTQQNRLADVIKGIGDELGAMATGQPAPANAQGLVTDLTAQAADRVENLASFLSTREPADVLNEVSRFARRRPGMFLLLAGLTGVVAGRVTRGLADDARREELPARPVTTPPVGYGNGTSRPVADYSMSDTAAMPTGYGAAVPPPVTEPDVHGDVRRGER